MNLGHRFTDLNEAAKRLRDGGVVAFPTETVYGLGARFDSTSAVAKIFRAKRRPSDNPLIVHCARVSELLLVCREITPSARSLLAAFSPGPLTVVLPRQKFVPDCVTAGLDTVAVRIPRHDLALALIDSVGVPLVAPSANVSGRPSPTTWEAVLEDFEDQIDGVLVGEPTEIGLESTVVDCSESPPRLLRAGGISLEQLQAVLPDIIVPQAHDLARSRSPGTLHRHYAPRARVVLFDRAVRIQPDHHAVCFGLTQRLDGHLFGNYCCYPSLNSYAHDLFEAFRRADRAGYRVIYCERVEPIGLGRALMDRLERAAAGSQDSNR